MAYQENPAGLLPEFYTDIDVKNLVEIWGPNQQ